MPTSSKRKTLPTKTKKIIEQMWPHVVPIYERKRGGPGYSKEINILLRYIASPNTLPSVIQERKKKKH
jgi:hypothetical protein